MGRKNIFVAFWLCIVRSVLGFFCTSFVHFTTLQNNWVWLKLKCLTFTRPNERSDGEQEICLSSLSCLICMMEEVSSTTVRTFLCLCVRQMEGWKRDQESHLTYKCVETAIRWKWSREKNERWWAGKRLMAEQLRDNWSLIIFNMLRGAQLQQSDKAISTVKPPKEDKCKCVCVCACVWGCFSS